MAHPLRSWSPMAISALVLTLHPGAPRDLLAGLAGDPRITVGEPIGDRVPLVAETSSARSGVELCEELLRMVGVLRVDVVSVDFTGEDEWTDAHS